MEIDQKVLKKYLNLVKQNYICKQPGGRIFLTKPRREPDLVCFFFPNADINACIDTGKKEGR